MESGDVAFCVCTDEGGCCQRLAVLGQRNAQLEGKSKTRAETTVGISNQRNLHILILK